MDSSPASVALDLLLALGACLRLTRFVVADDLPGLWYIKGPLWRWQRRRLWPEDRPLGSDRAAMPPGSVREEISRRTGEWTAPAPERYVEGLSCPFCMSVWMSAFVTLTLLVAGGPGDAADWWRYVAGFLTLAWVTGHVAKRMGDTE